MPFSFLWGNICKAIRTMLLMQISKRFLIYTSCMESYKTGTRLIVQGRNKKKKEIISKWFSSLNCFGIVSIRISISLLWKKLPNQPQNICISFFFPALKEIHRAFNFTLYTERNATFAKAIKDKFISSWLMSCGAWASMWSLTAKQATASVTLGWPLASTQRYNKTLQSAGVSNW